MNYTSNLPIVNKTAKYLKYSVLFFDDIKNRPLAMKKMFKIYKDVYHKAGVGRFIGYLNYDDINYPNHMFIVFKKGALVDAFIDYLLKDQLPLYNRHFNTSDYTVLIYKHPIKELVTKFLNGQYSKMYHGQAEHIKNPVVSPNKLLSESLRAQIAEELDVDTDLITELDEKPNIEDEVFQTDKIFTPSSR